MTVHLSFFIILAGLTGVHSITTVSKVSVKPGGSVTIPCLYDSKYIHHVKYLCKGGNWDFCTSEIKTNQPHSSGKFSISDDKTQRIFTVTMKSLTDGDTGHYWCAVEINKGLDDKTYFHLSVTWGTSRLYVDHQEITGFNGDSISISCHSQNSGEMKWCRLGSSCVTGSSGSLDRTTVTIDAKTRNSFTVTMSRLRTENSGWYLCVKGDLQMPVHLTVTEKPTTTTCATTKRLTTLSATQSVRLTPVTADEKLSTVWCEQSCSVSVDQKMYIIVLILLIFLVTVTLFICFMLKKHKKTKSASASMTEDLDTVTRLWFLTEETRSYAEEDVDVMYSSVVFMRPQSAQRVEANDDSVIYSTLAQHMHR